MATIELKIDRILDEYEEAVDVFLLSEGEEGWGRVDGLGKALSILKDNMDPFQKNLFETLCEEVEAS